jgi:AcrR family transcriptional regulator
VVIILSREEKKLATKERIIQKATLILEEKGFVKVSTKDISKASDVSHGTIFLHFNTKDELLYTILESNVNSFKNTFVERCNSKLTQDIFIKEFISVYFEFENILSRVYKDYYYLSSDLQKTIDDLETLIKNEIFDNLKNHWSKSLNILDTFTLIDAFLAQIKSYLLEKNSSSVQSIIKQRRGRILKLYNMLFMRS